MADMFPEPPSVVKITTRGVAVKTATLELAHQRPKPPWALTASTHSFKYSRLVLFCWSSRPLTSSGGTYLAPAQR